MKEHALLLVLSGSLLTYGLLSRRIEYAGLSAPMVVTLIGILAGPLVLNWAAPTIEHSALKHMAELTLAVILFTDASQIKRSHLIKDRVLPIRLLALGLPLTFILGWVLAVPLLGLSWLAAAWLAIMLTPTDAALAQATISNPDTNALLRRAITVESGLNDGLALPVLLFILALMQAGDYAFLDADEWPLFVLQQFVVGSLAGWCVGRFGGQLIHHASHNHSILPLYQRLSSLALALLAYAGAEVLGGNGFIAAFLAGLFLKAHHSVVIERLKEFGEAEGQLLALSVFFLFGLMFVAEAWPLMQWEHVLYALLSLTVVRMIPVLLSLTGSGLSWSDQLFLGWFGPRGIASVLYLLIAVEQMGYANSIPEYDAVFSTTVLTVLLSIFLHGLSTHVCQRRNRQPAPSCDES